MKTTLQTMRHCKVCGKQTLHVHTESKPTHLAHFILSCVTMGFWIPIWILAAIMAAQGNKKAKCTICGGKKPKTVTPPPLPALTTS